MSIRVVVCGARGRMGAESVRAIESAEDLEIVALVDTQPFENESRPHFAALASALGEVSADVCLDFTQPDAAHRHALESLRRGVAVVIGSSGIGETEQSEIRRTAEKCGTPAMWVPNFAIGAILMMRFAEEAARWMPEAAVVEMHHPGKVDAPSGTAKHTAHRIASARSGFSPRPYREDLVEPGALGAAIEGVPVHSVRMSGLVAHQEVLFGGPGETLTIRHDSMDRVSFMPGVLLAIRKVRAQKGLTIGLESIMFSS